MARFRYGIGMSIPNIKTSKTYKFEFENFGSDKTVLCKTYVTYGGNAKERKSTYRKRIFFIRNCALFRKTHLSFRTFFTDKLRTYGAFSVRNRYVLPVLCKTYVTYRGNAKERKSTYRKRIFFIRNCALFRKTHLSFRTFLVRFRYGIGTFFTNIKTSKTYKFEFENFG